MPCQRLSIKPGPEQNGNENGNIDDETETEEMEAVDALGGTCVTGGIPFFTRRIVLYQK
jgi:hypothetical protein